MYKVRKSDWEVHFQIVAIGYLGNLEALKQYSKNDIHRYIHDIINSVFFKYRKNYLNQKGKGNS